MNGLEFLDKIMRLRPTPVIMVSSLTLPGQSATIEALRLGAFECIPKPSTAGGRDTLALLPALVHEAKRAKTQIAGSRDRRFPPRRPRTMPGPTSSHRVVDGRRRGADRAARPVSGRHAPGHDRPAPAGELHGVLRRAPRSCVPGHRGRGALGRADPEGPRLSRAGRPPPDGAPQRRQADHDADGRGPRPGSSSVGGHAVPFDRQGLRRPGHGRDPDRHGARRGGRSPGDAAEGFRTLAQDEATSLVYGMPRVAWEIGAAEKRVPIGGMAKAIFN